MKKTMVILCTMLLWFGIVGSANAELKVIGTASYLGSNYNLIYEGDNNGQNLIWLDYTHGYANWQDQMDWATGLNASGVLAYNLNPGISVTWGSEWRLPATVDGLYVLGYDGTTTAGYNITTSEMGHLYYESLRNKALYATDGTNPQPGWGLNNTFPFTDLQAYIYWSGTEYSLQPIYAWNFDFGTTTGSGGQGTNVVYKTDRYFALAVRSGLVTVDITIDIKPGVFPNTIILGSKGLVPVAILTIPDFDASTVDPVTVTFDGTTVATKSRMIDVDHDGDKDLLLYFNTQDLNLNKDSTEATLTGKTDDEMDIVGTDFVKIVTKGKK